MGVATKQPTTGQLAINLRGAMMRTGTKNTLALNRDVRRGGGVRGKKPRFRLVGTF